MADKEMLSLVVPCYNEEEALPIFYEEACKVVSGMNELNIEMLFVDDGSHDNTIGVIKELADKDDRVHYVSFSRNFGKEAAIYAGLDNAVGDYVVILDADLQDPPSLLPEMMETIKTKDCDCVGTRRVNRKGEPPIRSFFARRFYRIMNKISHTEVVDGARDFQLMKRKVVNAILSMGEYNRFSKGIFGWVGYKKEWLEYENIERAAGETKWSFWSLFVYALEGIVAFSTAPLVIASVSGIVMFFIAIIGIIFIVVRTLVFGDPTSGWPSMVCIMLLIAGIQLLCMGILGEYLGKTYLETKRRPLYLVEESKLAEK